MGFVYFLLGATSMVVIELIALCIAVYKVNKK